MATCNFSVRHNSDFIYAFCEGSDFDAYLEEYKQNNEIGDDEDDYSLREALYGDWYDFEKDYYLERLENELYKLTPEGSGYYTDFTESRRITDGDEVATVHKYINFAGASFMVLVSVDFESGYYEGFALDWNIKKIEGDHYLSDYYDHTPDEADCVDLLRDNTNLNEGLCRALAAKLQVKIESTQNEITTIIESALKEVSPYHLTGFCLDNGEGLYTNHKKAS